MLLVCMLVVVWVLLHGHGGAAWLLLPGHALLRLLRVARCAVVPASLHILQRKSEHRRTNDVR
jgi:hypothetical protein